MKKHLYFFFTVTIIAASVSVLAQNAIGFGSQTTTNQELLTKNPLKGSGMLFTPNKGQIADMKGNLCPEILYKGDGGGADVYLRKTGMSYVTSNMSEVMSEINKEVELKKFDPNFSQQQVEELKRQLEEKALIKIQRTDVDFAGGNPNSETLNQEEVEGYTNYYYAHCPNGITNVKSYNRVIQKNIYKGIDVVYYGGKEKGLKYDIVINPGANPNQIKLKYTGAKVKKLADGSLQIASELGLTKEYLPKVYQNINGEIVDVGCEYKLVNSEKRIGNREKTPPPNGYSLLAIGSIVTFELTTYNHSYPLIIDPLIWATYYGGTQRDYGNSTACDNTGNVYLAGATQNTSVIASTTGYQAVFGGLWDAFLVQFNAATGVRNWATYYGGLATDWGYSTACDNAGNVYLTGFTQSSSMIAATTAHQLAFGGGTDAFLVQFNATTGARNWATYYGGSNNDVGYSTTCDNAGKVYLAGNTSSTNAIASPIAHQAVSGGGDDGFLVQFDGATGTRNWATYYGGTNNDVGYSTACNNAGNVYLAGVTQSTNAIALSPAHQPVLGGVNDAFLAQFDAATGTCNWATYYGGTANDFGYSTACDKIGNVYLAGYTASTSAIATAASYQPVYGGGTTDTYLVQFNTAGVFKWSTYYGSWFWEILSTDKAITTDGNNNVYLYLEDEEQPGPNLDPCAYQPIFAGGTEDQIIVKFTSAGKKICATYFGGIGYEDLDDGGAIAISGNSLFICTSNGQGMNGTATPGGGYPVTPGAWQTVHGNTALKDAVLASLCINICEAKTLGLNYTANTTSVCTNAPIKFTPSVNNSCDTTGYKFHWMFTGGTPTVSDSVSPTVKFSGVGNYDVKLVVTTLCKKDSITKINYITVNNCGCTLNAQYTKGTTNCPSCGCKEWIMVTGINGTPPYNYQWPDGYDKRYKNALCPGIYNVIVTDNNGCKATVKVNAP
ncbi:MAG: hypothetical protein IT235_04305 [Bacteroidia bacterium]|nr:hypothetical protein [Bacteroidia bacterium]